MKIRRGKKCKTKRVREDKEIGSGRLGRIRRKRGNNK
jgi:hypothetical protein